MKTVQHGWSLQRAISTIKDNKIPIAIAWIQWFLTTVFQIDRLFFTYSNGTKIYVGIKILYLMFLIIAWCFLFHVRAKVKEQNEIYKRGLYVFSCYLFVMMILLVILWPGTWAWDDLRTLAIIQNYDSLYHWQHILTGTYQDVLLQILPFPGGIILLQNIIISVCVAFCVTKLEICFKIKRLKNKSIDIIIKIIPFLLFPVMMYQFSGYRMGIYVYLELVMLVMLMCAAKDKREWGLEYCVLFGVLCAVVSAWRTESFFYIPFACILLFIVNKNILPNRKKAVCILCLFVCFAAINAGQNHFMKNNNYKVVSLIRPCAELVRVADEKEDAELLAAIGKVVHLDVIYDNPETNGERLWWDKGVGRNDYTKEEYGAFLKAFIKLAAKYPKTVIVERCKLFAKGSGIIGTTAWNVNTSVHLFEGTSTARSAETYLNGRWIARMPVFKELRKNLIYLFGGESPDETRIVPLNRLIWNALIPIAILLFAWIRLLVKKKWYLFFICSAVLIRLPVVILTEPSGWMMYLLSFYFLGYVYLIYQLLIFFMSFKKYSLFY